MEGAQKSHASMEIITSLQVVISISFFTSTDSMEKMCVDLGEMGAALQGWGSQGARPTRRRKGRAVGIRQWKGIDVKEMLQNIGDGLVTTSSHVYAQSTYHCASCINHHTGNHNKNRVLL
jgi:hypothetical protein